MGEGSGADTGSIYGLLAEVARTVSRQDAAFEQMRTGRAVTQAELASLRQALTEYHTSVLGHCILISELDERVRRIERHIEAPRLVVR